MEASGPPLPSSLEVSLEDFFSVRLLITGKHSQCNAPGPNRNLLLFLPVQCKESQTVCQNSVARVSETQVCFRVRQESQDIKSWCKRTLPALWFVYLTLSFAAALFSSSGGETCACRSPSLQLIPMQQQPSATGAARGNVTATVLEVWGGTPPCTSVCGVDVASPPDHQSLKGEVAMLPVLPRN